MLTNERVCGEDVFVHKHGHLYSVSFTTDPIRKGDLVRGTVIEFQVIAILEGHQDRLQREQKMFRSIVEGISDGFFSLNRTWQFTYMNPEAERIVAKRFEDEIGRTIWHTFPGLIGSTFESAYHRCMDQGEPSRTTAFYPDHDRWYDVICYPHAEGISILFRDVTEQQTAALAAEKERKLLETILEYAPLGIGVADASGHLLRLNPATTRMWGSAAPLAGSVEEYRAYRGWFGIGGDGPQVEPHEWPMARALGGQVVEPQLFAIEPFDAPGTRRPVAISAAPVRDDTGVITGAVAMHFDLTELVAAQDAVYKSEARFRAAVTAVSSIVWTNNSRGEMEGEQVGWAAFTGQSYQDYQGFGWANAVHPEDAKTSIQAWNQAVADRRMFLSEHRVRRHDGVWRRFSIRAVPILEPDGSIREWVGVHTDVTEERHLVDALQDSEHRFRAVADNIAQLAWTADATGYISWYNRRWYEFTGTTFEQMQGWGWQAVHDPDHVVRVTDKFLRDIAAGVAWEDTFPLRSADGNYRWFLSRAFPIRNDAGQITMWFGTNTDVTEHLETERALRRSNGELEQFIFVAAHDLQEPLRNISISGDLAERKLIAGESCRPYLVRMRESALRMQRLIADLLTYSRVIHEEDKAGQESDLESALDETVAILGQRILETGTIITHDPLPNVHANPRQMTIVFQNLLANAMKYQPEGGKPRIHITSVSMPSLTTIRVSDNGIGFEPEYAERIFGLFKRLHTDRYEGTGLGLAICRRIIERYHGRMWAESTGEGHGATFIFELPMVAP